MVDCPTCEREFETERGVRVREACRRAWLSEAFAGEGHPNWKGGDTGPYGKGWNAVREAALERDDYRCVVCGAAKDEIGRNPDVHHIVPVRVFVESADHERTDAHALENVVSLCVGCHRKAKFGEIPASRLREAIDVAAPSDTPADAAGGSTTCAGWRHVSPSAPSPPSPDTSPFSEVVA